MVVGRGAKFKGSLDEGAVVEAQADREESIVDCLVQRFNEALASNPNGCVLMPGLSSVNCGVEDGLCGEAANAEDGLAKRRKTPWVAWS